MPGFGRENGNYILDVGSPMCECVSAESKDAAGAPEHEIEIPAEVIDEGVFAFLDVDRRVDGIEVAMKAAFLAMLAASRVYTK
jgi:hypothetical protein